MLCLRRSSWALCSDIGTRGNGRAPYNLPVRALRAALLLAFGAFVLGTWLARAWCARWIADDFCFAVSGIRDGFWRSQALVYQNASGRYTVAFLYAVVTRFGAWTARWLAIGALGLWIAAAWRCLRRAEARRSTESFAIAIGFVAAIVNAAPDAYQPLIWTGGLLTYGLPVIGATVMAALIEGPAVILFALAIVFGGCSEVAAVAQIAFGTALAVVLPPFRRALVAIAAGSAIALVVVSIAPGNFQRRTLFHPLPLPQALVTAIEKTVPTYGQILVEGCTLFVPLMVVIALGSVRVPWRVAWAAVAASIVVVSAAVFGGLVGTGRLPWGRVQFVPVAYVTIALVLMALALRIERYAAIATLVSVLFGATGIATTAPARMAEIRESIQFAQAADRVAAAPRGTHAVVVAPHDFDYLDFVHRDPDFWSNRCIASWYGLLSVRSSR